MYRFKQVHPLVNFIYFLIVIMITCMYIHPVIEIISCVFAVAYNIFINGFEKTKNNVIKFLCFGFIIIAINVLFNHEGITPLYYFKNNNAITLEALIFGVNMSIMIIAVIMWCIFFREVMDDERFFYLFSRSMPRTTLVASMVMRFIPVFNERFKDIRHFRSRIFSGNKTDKISINGVNNKKNINSINDKKNINSVNNKNNKTIKTIKNRIPGNGYLLNIKEDARILNCMIGWSMENSIDISDSMQARGYTGHKKTSYELYRFRARDFVLIMFMLIFLLMFVYITAFVFYGDFLYSFYPMFSIKKTIYNIYIYILFSIICLIPVIV